MNPPSRRYLRLLWIVAAVVGLASLTAFWWWTPPAFQPPPIELSEVDPAVAEAIDQARAAVLAAPRSAPRWGQLGMVLRAHDFADQANTCFAQAEQLDPKEGRWPYYRGLTLVMTDPQAGLACLRRAVERLPDASAPAFRLVEVLLEQGATDEAANRLQMLLQDQPDSIRGRLLQARLQLFQQQWYEALQTAEELLLLPQARMQAHRVAIQACYRLGQSERAEQLQRVLAALPADQPWYDPLVAEVERLKVGFQPRLGYALTLDQQGQSRQAIDLLKQLLSDYPREVSGWLALARLYRAVQQVSDAEQALQKAVSLQPDFVEGWLQLGIIRLLLKQPERAEEAFTKTIRLKPDSALAHYNLGVCRHQLGDPEGARRAWAETLRCEPENELALKALDTLNKKP